MDNSEHIPVLFQDEKVIVVNKPEGLPVHRNDFMPHDAPYLTKLLGNQTGKWIYNVHRLDSKTSGVMVLAFSPEAARHLTLQFEQKRVRKTYVAIVQGEPGNGTFDRKVLVKKKSKFKKSAITRYQTINTVHTQLDVKERTNIPLSLVEIFPDTGRWHQIRQHFSQAQFDLLGDTHHGNFTLNRMVTQETGIKRLCLHAKELTFYHPDDEREMAFTCDMPDEFSLILQHFA